MPYSYRNGLVFEDEDYEVFAPLEEMLDYGYNETRDALTDWDDRFPAQVIYRRRDTRDYFFDRELNRGIPSSVSEEIAYWHNESDECPFEIMSVDGPSQPAEPVQLENRTFIPPRNTYPDGPFSREYIENETYAELLKMPVTRDNVAQLVWKLATPLNDRVRNVLAPYRLTKNEILHEPTRHQFFGTWPTQDLDKIALLAEQYILMHDGFEAWIYYPQIVFHDEETETACVCGPFAVSPGLGTFRTRYIGRHELYISPLTERISQIDHPHIRDGEVCLGTEQATYQMMRRAGDLLGLAMTFENLVVEYNPESPYPRQRLREQFAPTIGGLIHQEQCLVTSSYGRPDIKSIPISSDYRRDECAVNRYTLYLYDFERQVAQTIEPEIFNSWLLQCVQQFATNSLESPAIRTWIDCSLPMDEEDNRINRIRLAGFEVEGGFNISDQPLTAITKPHKKEHCFDFTDEERNRENNPVEGNDPDERAPEAAADSRPTEVTTTYTEPSF